MTLESLSDKCSQAPILQFEGFIVRPFDGWRLWIENPSGEGMTIDKVRFLVMLNKFFEDF